MILSAPPPARERPKRRAAVSEETLAAFAHFCTLRDRDLDAQNADERTRKMVEVGLNTPSTHFDPVAPKPTLPAPKPEPEEPSIHPPEGWSYGKPKPKPAPPPRTEWSLKDEGFDP